MARKITLMMPDDVAKVFKHHPFYAQFITREVCAHANVGPCTQTHRCSHRGCNVFESNHGDKADAQLAGEHEFESVTCGTGGCLDCGDMIL